MVGQSEPKRIHQTQRTANASTQQTKILQPSASLIPRACSKLQRLFYCKIHEPTGLSRLNNRERTIQLKEIFNFFTSFFSTLLIDFLQCYRRIYVYEFYLTVENSIIIQGKI